MGNQLLSKLWEYEAEPVAAARYKALPLRPDRPNKYVSSADEKMAVEDDAAGVGFKRPHFAAAESRPAKRVPLLWADVQRYAEEVYLYAMQILGHQLVLADEYAEAKRVVSRAEAARTEKALVELLLRTSTQPGTPPDEVVAARVDEIDAALDALEEADAAYRTALRENQPLQTASHARMMLSTMYTQATVDQARRSSSSSSSSSSVQPDVKGPSKYADCLVPSMRGLVTDFIGHACVPMDVEWPVFEKASSLMAWPPLFGFGANHIEAKIKRVVVIGLETKGATTLLVYLHLPGTRTRDGALKLQHQVDIKGERPKAAVSMCVGHDQVAVCNEGREWWVYKLTNDYKLKLVKHFNNALIDGRGPIAFATDDKNTVFHCGLGLHKVSLAAETVETFPVIGVNNVQSVLQDPSNGKLWYSNSRIHRLALGSDPESTLVGAGTRLFAYYDEKDKMFPASYLRGVTTIYDSDFNVVETHKTAMHDMHALQCADFTGRGYFRANVYAGNLYVSHCFKTS